MKKIPAYYFLVLLILVTSCVRPKPPSANIPVPEYWPTSGWKHSTPEAQGMDSGLLAGMIEDISANETSIHSVIVVRNGYMVTEAYFHPYTSDTKMHVQSVTKSVIGMLVGIALKKGIIPDINQPMIDFFRNRRIAYLDEQFQLTYDETGKLVGTAFAFNNHHWRNDPEPYALLLDPDHPQLAESLLDWAESSGMREVEVLHGNTFLTDLIQSPDGLRTGKCGVLE